LVEEIRPVSLDRTRKVPVHDGERRRHWMKVQWQVTPPGETRWARQKFLMERQARTPFELRKRVDAWAAKQSDERLMLGGITLAGATASLRTRSHMPR
jgi:hypothetical protein